MPIIFYTTRSLPSPPARAVETVIKILKLNVEKRLIDLGKKEHLEPWYIKINPLHQVPAIDDNGFVLNDSHAIIAYLLTVYAPKDILEQYYPTDLKLRGIVDSRWHFEHGTLFARIKTILLPLLVWGEKETPLEKTRWLIEGVEFLEKFLEAKEWLAGDRLTVADISTIMTIDLVDHLVPLKHYKNVSAWAERTRKACPHYNEVGIEDLKVYTENFVKNLNYDSEDRWNQVQSILKK